jgi:hypothetical protein
MIEYAFVMVISTNPFKDDFKYIGNFESCQQAALYVSLHHPDKKASRCLMKDYIYLPKDTILRNIDMRRGTIRYFDKHDFCKVRRNCNG